MMDDYINSEETIKTLMECSINIYNHVLDELEYKGLTIRQWADKIANEEYQPVKHAQWEYEGTIGGKKYYYCTNCDNNIKNIAFGQLSRDLWDETKILWWEFCPICGARMDGDSK